MKRNELFIQKGLDRVEVDALPPYLRHSIEAALFMDPTLMQSDEIESCHWVLWGLTKGVTHQKTGLTILSQNDRTTSGQHAELIQGFPYVDPVELCYSDKRVLGFGHFIRWVYFANPSHMETEKGILGIDWSLNEPENAGVATSMLAVSHIATHLLRHGLSPKCELVLLNWKMLEPRVIEAWRKEMRLVTLFDWSVRAAMLFHQDGFHCPFCGMETFRHDEPYCFRCGKERRKQWLGNPVRWAGE